MKIVVEVLFVKADQQFLLREQVQYEITKFANH